MDDHIHAAASALHRGEIISFPTETFYGLGVDPYNHAAIELLFTIKQRDRKKPILVLINNLKQLEGLVKSVPQEYKPFIEKFWPGPLTLLFHASAKVPPIITGKTDVIGIRLTPHPVARKIIEIFGGPVTATSANPSGKEPASTAAEVYNYFGENIGPIVDGGKTKGNLCSTVISMLTGKIELIRPGEIPFEQLNRLY